MDWLNYHHLYYFWTVVQAGTIQAAAEQLHLARPTIAAQLKALERQVGQPLFKKRGRKLEPTEFGLQIYNYAHEIFSLGHELREFVRTGQAGRRPLFRVGLADVVPKAIAYEVLRPALGLNDPPKLIVHEGKLADLLSDLGRHRLDLVLSDAPCPPTVELKVYNHLLGECGLSWLAMPKLAAAHRQRFPQSLTGAPCLLPTEHTAVRRALDHWLSEQDIFPQVVAEFEDSALLKIFGEAGEGIFPVPTAVEAKVVDQLEVAVVGRMPEVLDRFYAISAEKRVQHPATLAIVRQARTRLFETSEKIR